MANYHNLKNAAILTPTTNTDLGSDSNRYSNVYMSGNIVMSNGVTVTSTNVITPKIASVTYPANDTAADTAGGQTLTITGSGFSSGASVLIGTTPSTVVTVVSSTSITFTSPALVAGTYSLYVINSDGGTAIYIPGVAFSGTPTWSTSSGSLSTVYETNSISSTVAATGDATISYSVVLGTLPTGSSLNTSTGLISGTAPASSGSTTYTFTIRATDGQNQDTDRSFSITVNTDAVTWNSPADNASTSLDQGLAMSTVTLNATSAAGKSITYSANALPTGLSISTNTIVGTPTVLGSTTSLITATAADSSRTATRTLSWVVSVASEPYWMYTTLLLNGEGDAASNNATNNTFIDSSTNTYTVNKFGSTAQGSFSPYSQGSWSNYFDGTGDYLQTPSSVSSSLGTSNFTWECWIYRNAVTDATYADAICCVSTGTNGFAVGVNPDGKVGYAISSAGTWDVRRGVDPGDPRGSIVIPLNTWRHIALVRNGSTFTGYVNGAQDQTFTSSGSISSISSNYNIGKWHDGNNRYWNGYISNFRFVVGTAVYTTTFTPPTTPLTAITNTSLLTCQSNRFIDNSTNNFTITRNGDTTVTKFSPFNGTTGYNPETYGGSAYFNGSTDYLTVPYNNNFNIPSSTAFTFECWVYTTTSNFYALFGRNWSFGADGPTYAFHLTNGTTPGWSIAGTGSATYVMMNNGIAGTLGQWNHYVWTRDASNVCKMYTNGVEATGSTRTDSRALTAASGDAYIGISTNLASPYLNGYLSNLRLVVGTAVYTGSFTPPTQPLTAIANTALLLKFTNAGVIDQTGMHDLRTFGNAKISTAEKKYNSGSISLTNGSGDYCLVPYNPIYTFGTGDFTIEAWVYRTDTGVQRAIVDNSAGQSNRILFYITSNNKLNMFDGTNTWLSSTNTVTANQWVHVAVARASGTTKLFINGTQEASTSDSRNYIQGAVGLHIGRQNGATVNDFMGYIDDFRITRGYARYTATFTPPTTSLNLK